MNKRTSERYDFSNEFIPVKVSSFDKREATCILKDISTSGISFYSFSDSISPDHGKYVTTEFEFNGVIYKFETQILREERKHFGFMNAARIVGINTHNTRKFKELIDAVEVSLYSFS